MAKLVTKFRYYKNKKTKLNLGGYAKYISYRDGVEKLHEDINKPATLSQEELIKKILEDFPDSAEMLEYEDYLDNPTIINATEFITRALEDNAQSAYGNKTYADYIATRPRVEKTREHGLFSHENSIPNLAEVSAELNSHEGYMWTIIVSLRRDDAERLSYNNAKAWKDLISSNAMALAESLKIPFTELKWYAAFHNESHHPHVHIIAYCDDIEKGYLSRQGIMHYRSALGNAIFRDELNHVFEDQTKHRNKLKEEWRELIREIISEIENKNFENPELERKMIELSYRLGRTKGKKQYGYLDKDIKKLVDEIVDLIAEDEKIAELYDLWYEKKFEILRTYTSDMPPIIPLSKNKEFRSIKNEIIKQAMRILLNDEGDVEKILSEKQGYYYYKNGETADRSEATKQKYYQSRKGSVSSSAVTRLFKNIANIFAGKIDDDYSKKLPVIDKRQHREIEDKKNAEITMV